MTLGVVVDVDEGVIARVGVTVTSTEGVADVE